MKSFTFLLLLTLCFPSVAQDRKGVYFQYHINVRAMDTALQVRQTAVMMNQSYMKIYCYGDSLRFEHSMGKMLKRVQIMDKKQQNGITLIDGPMGKTATYDNLDNIEYLDVQKDSNAVVVEFDETKTILGFECHKIILRQGDNISTHWVTHEIDADMLPEGMTNPNIPGFPLESIEVAGGLEITRKASDVRFEIENPEVVFSLDLPEGYQVVRTATSH